MPKRRPPAREAANDTEPELDHVARGAHRPIWAGTLGFGLVQIPVSLVSAEVSRGLSLKQLDRRDLSPVGIQRVNKSTGEPVDWSDIVKGYEVAKGEYVVLSDEELEQASPTATQAIEIRDVVPRAEIPIRFFERPYYLVPGPRGGRAYALLREVLEAKDLAAVGMLVLRTRAHVCAVFADQRVLTLELLRFEHALRPPQAIRVDAQEPASPKERALAEQLVGGMITDWDPARYTDTFADAVHAAVAQKTQAGEVTPRAPAPAPAAVPVDLVELLQQSLAREPRARRPNRRARGTGKGRAARR